MDVLCSICGVDFHDVMVVSVKHFVDNICGREDLFTMDKMKDSLREALIAKCPNIGRFLRQIVADKDGVRITMVKRTIVILKEKRRSDA